MSDTNVHDSVSTFAKSARSHDKCIVAVVGLGFVGCANSVAIARSLNNVVIGLDRDNNSGQQKIDDINSGVFPISSSDTFLLEEFQAVYSAGSLLASSDPSVLYHADVVVIDINLDADREEFILHNKLEVDINIFGEAMGTIGTHISPNALVVIETTVPPGTMENIVEPVLNDAFSKRGITVPPKLVHCYERVMPGENYLESIVSAGRVYSTSSDSDSEAFVSFLSSFTDTTLHPPVELSSWTASEMGKVMENTFRAANIALIEEWTVFAEAAGVNLHEVIAAIRQRPTHRNIMAPGLGVGGYCLPKDPLLASWASSNFFGLERMKWAENAVRTNEQMPVHAFELINEMSNRSPENRVGIVGISYLANVGDLRNSSSLYLMDLLRDHKYDVTWYDPYILESEAPVNRTSSFEVLTSVSDILVFSTPHRVFFKSEMIDQWSAYLESGGLVLDCWGSLHGALPKSFRFLDRIKVLGNGQNSGNE